MQALSHKYFQVGQYLSTPSHTTAAVRTQGTHHPSQPRAHHPLSEKHSSAASPLPSPAPSQLSSQVANNHHNPTQITSSFNTKLNEFKAIPKIFSNQKFNRTSNIVLNHQRTILNPVSQLQAGTTAARPSQSIISSRSSIEEPTRAFPVNKSQEKIKPVNKTEAAR